MGVVVSDPKVQAGVVGFQLTDLPHHARDRPGGEPAAGF